MKGRYTSDHIYILQTIMDQNVTFVDFKKAYNKVNHKVLLELLIKTWN